LIAAAPGIIYPFCQIVFNAGDLVAETPKEQPLPVDRIAGNPFIIFAKNILAFFIILDVYDLGRPVMDTPFRMLMSRQRGQV
jgi:hypothetical protein